MPIPPRPTFQSKRSKPDLGIGDWFVYDGEVLSGPHSDDELGEMSDDPVRRRNLQVSREGFNRWYAIDELNKMLTLNRAPLKRETLTDTSELREYFDQVSKKLDRLGDAHAAPIPKVDRTNAAFDEMDSDYLNASSELESFLNDKNLAGRSTERRVEATPSESIKRSEPVAKPKVEAKIVAGQPLPNNDFAHFLAQATIGSGSESPKFERPTAVEWDEFIAPRSNETNIAVKSQSNSKMPEYLDVKSKLRLGTRLNPFSLAFVALPLTLGLYVTSWYRTIVAELLFHVSGEYKNTLPDAHLSWLPGAHFVAFHRLARLVREVERQNGYSSTRPWVIVLAACFPPLAVFLIQLAVNRHWNLHFTSQCKTD